MPQKLDGIRIEPAPSEPWWSGPSPAAAATAAPALEPPEVMPGFHGLRVMPVSGLSPSAFQPNSGVVRSEEHTSELQSLAYLVCRLLLEKKKKKKKTIHQLQS